MGNSRASHGFRKKINENLPFWQDKGFITPIQSEQMADFYQLDLLKSETTRLTAKSIYLIGVFLIGIGIISFVASHWTAISREMKVVMLFSAFLIAHGTGFYLWQISGRFPRLGHALIVLGTLIFGANIGLLAQIFHVRDNPANVYMAWSIGAAAIAYALRSSPNALIAITASLIFLLTRVFTFSGSLLWFPFFSAALFIPLAYRCRSRWVIVAALSTIALSASFSFVPSQEDSLETVYVPVFVAIAFFSGGLLNLSHERTAYFSTPFCAVGLATGLICFYLMSFLDIAEDIHRNYAHYFTTDSRIKITAGLIGLTGLCMGIYTLLNKKFSLNSKSTLILLIIAALSVLVLGRIHAVALVAAANILLFALAANLIRIGTKSLNRGLFWAGILLIGVVILSRTIEYETDLLIKAIIFIACGVGVIVAGIMFERQLKTNGA